MKKHHPTTQFEPAILWATNKRFASWPIPFGKAHLSLKATSRIVGQSAPSLGSELRMCHGCSKGAAGVAVGLLILCLPRRPRPLRRLDRRTSWAGASSRLPSGTKGNGGARGGGEGGEGGGADGRDGVNVSTCTVSVSRTHQRRSARSSRYPGLTKNRATARCSKPILQSISTCEIVFH